MNEKATYSLKKLQAEFDRRMQKNPRYSLRAFARFLDIEAPSMSAILKGKRGIPRHKVAQVIEKLGLSPEESLLFRKGIGTKAGKNQKEPQDIHELEFLLNSEIHFNIISEWEHGAILSLIETATYQSSIPWMAQRLGVPENRIGICLRNLVTAELVTNDNGTYRRNPSRVGTTDGIPSAAIKKAHRENLRLGEEAIDNISVEDRDLSSVTVTIRPEDLPALKQSIRNFRRRFMKKAETEVGEEVYKLSIQLIPLTKLEPKRRSQ